MIVHDEFWACLRSGACAPSYTFYPVLQSKNGLFFRCIFISFNIICVFTSFSFSSFSVFRFIVMSSNSVSGQNLFFFFSFAEAKVMSVSFAIVRTLYRKAISWRCFFFQFFIVGQVNVCVSESVCVICVHVSLSFPLIKLLLAIQCVHIGCTICRIYAKALTMLNSIAKNVFEANKSNQYQLPCTTHIHKHIYTWIVILGATTCNGNDCALYSLRLN